MPLIGNLIENLINPYMNDQAIRGHGLKVRKFFALLVQLEKLFFKVDHLLKYSSNFLNLFAKNYQNYLVF